MKDEYKILIGAIIVILIVLVGAYALSGSNNPGPGVSPTAVPATATPTTVPEGGGSIGGTPTATPTVVPTATPAPTPTPEPESGVKLTEFGYWITYPPLDPETWSTNPPPNPNGGNVVYFDPTSQTVFEGVVVGPGALMVVPQGQAIVHRDGNLSGTTNVLISVALSENMFYPSDYESGIWIPTGGPMSINPNLTDNYNGTFTLRFDPYVDNQTIYISVFPIQNITQAGGVSAEAFSYNGFATLTIRDVDPPFSKGDRDQYTLNVKNEPPV